MSVRLFILGLAQERDTHGYEIKETAKRWGVERWAKFGLGSIYHALGKLQEDGLLEEVGQSQDGNRPMRYVYRITEPGRAAFFALLRETCTQAETESREIDMALAFIHYLPPAERVEILTRRLENLQPRLDALTKSDAALLEDRTLMPWVAHGVRHSLGRVAFEHGWMQDVLKTVADWPAPSTTKEETP
jgi:DNA-binding PadR family transcriptional regulator